MDINMPRMDGLEATQHIMTQNPRPIVIVSSESKQGAASTLRALELGAIDFVTKPSSAIDLDMKNVRDEEACLANLADGREGICGGTASLGSLAQEPAARSFVNGKVESKSPAPARKGILLENSEARLPLVVIAASTGGPAALMRLMPSFPKDFPAAVLLALHMPATFTAQLSGQLGAVTVSSIRVKEAEQANEALQCFRTFYVCPGSHHMRNLCHERAGSNWTMARRISGYRPCADVALESAAAYGGANVVGVVLTGMGNDGAKRRSGP